MEKGPDQNFGVLAGPCLGLTCPEEHLYATNGILNLARSLAVGFELLHHP
jgi:hypothetical protein